MTEKKNWKVFFLGWSFLLVFAIAAYPQGTTGTFTGVVTDPSGAVVPGTSVIITNKATGVKCNLATNPAGVYYVRTWDTSVNSSYFGLQVEVVRKFSRGWAFTTAYTWSHSLDFRSTWHGLTSGGSATDFNAFGEAGYSLDPTRVWLEKGNSLFDVRHRWGSSVAWDLPWRKDMQGVSGKLLGGWTVNAVVGFQSGLPFTIGTSADLNGDGIGSDRPNTPSLGNRMSFSNFDFAHSSAPGGASKMSTLKGEFPFPSCTVPGDITCNGNLGRNTFRGPGIADADFSVFKKIPLGAKESRYLQFRTEIFNVFNHTNLDPPNANLRSVSFGLSQTALDPREIQLALKLYF